MLLEAVLEMVQRTAGGSVDADAPLMEVGVDSNGAVELRNQLQSASGVQSLPSTVVFEHPTARQLTAALQSKQEAIAVVAPRSNVAQYMEGNVAIDGASALFPSGVCSLWRSARMVACGRNTIMQVPAARWDVQEHPALSKPDTSRDRHAGFVCGIELLDSAAFAVSPAEVAAMDPCQRLLLEMGYTALHDAALDRTSLDGSLTGVFLGFSGSEFALVLAASPAGGGVYAATGSTISIAAGRISFTLGLHGPCVTYDTACSAALAAAHAGLRTLQLAECSVGLVVGVNLMLTPGVGTTLAVAGMTSARGRCHTFDARADGYARGEACGGAVVRHDERDEVQLSLLGSAVRQDGRSASLTAPNGQAQQGLLVAALEDAGTSVDTLALNEAHGTGTALGDPIETRAFVASVLSVREDALAMGSVKANTGHAEPAAGLTGLLKLALGLRVGEVAPNAQLRLLNEHVGDSLRGVSSAMPVQLAAKMQNANEGGVSSFGYSGTIAHAVLGCVESIAVSPNIPQPLLYRRRAFPWRDPPHPFAQHPMTSSDGTTTFRSPAVGALHTLVADHVVWGRVIFPGAGYLEMARAAGAVALYGVYFLRPLAMESPALLIDCVVSDGRFEVRSGEDGYFDDANVHCSGAAATDSTWQRIDNISLRSYSSAVDVGALYDSCDAVGLQYGPGYRTLMSAWGGASNALARLRARLAQEGTHVHPADLDDALCTSVAISSGGGEGETRLPFAVDAALLQAAQGELWAVRLRMLQDSCRPP
jgi:acyl transferase domain-containing protein